ncbi:hypothetical protein ACKWTF_014164 [Chironomus riparius]
MDLKLKLLSLIILINSTYSIDLNCINARKEFKGVYGIQSCVVPDNFTIHNEYEEVKLTTGILDKTIIYGFMANKREIYYIPKGIGAHLPSIKNLVINSSSLKEVTSENLKEFPNLIFLDLSNNHIKILDRDVFQHNPNLADIRLKNNLIFAIESGAFDQFKIIANKLSSLNLNGNNCEFKFASTRTFVLKAIENMNERCWNATSRTKFETYKNQRILEKIENKSKHLNKLVEDYSNRMQSLETNLKEMNSSHYDDLHALNISINERITRSAEDINDKIAENNKAVQDLINKVNSSQTSILSDILDKVTSSLKLQSATKILNQQSDDIAALTYQLSQLQTTFKNLKVNNNSIEITKCDSIHIQYLNTILLIIIITFQAFYFSCKSSTQPKSKKFKSKFVTTPPSLEPIYYRTATQLVDDYPKQNRHQTSYESYDDIQSCDFISTNRKQNNSNEVTKTVQADVEHHGFSNDIYGTITASSEDLYSEVISPKIVESRQDVNDGSDIYAVSIEGFRGQISIHKRGRSRMTSKRGGGGGWRG